MKDSGKRDEVLRRFLTGDIEGEELVEFQSVLHNDPDIRRRLNKTSGFEALMYDAVGQPVNDIRYSAVADKVVNGTRDVNRAAPTWLKLYALAATIVLVVVGGLLLESRVVPESSAPTATTDHNRPATLRQNAKSITRLAPDAVFVSEEGTKARVIKDADSVVNVVIAQGNTWFDVASRHNRQVHVVTPHGAASLHEAVFRIIVTELATEILVFDGMVEVVHREHRDSPEVLLAGSMGYADFLSINTAQTLNIDICQQRKLLLQTYLGWVREQVQG